MFRYALLIALLCLLAASGAAQGNQKRATLADDLQKSANECTGGTSSLTTQQCAFITQAALAIRQTNQLVESGEWAKLPPRTQDTVIALVNALRAAMPLMKKPEDVAGQRITPRSSPVHANQ